MKTKSRLFFALMFLLLPGVATAQVRLVKAFQITKISRDFVTTPVLAYAGGEAAPKGQPGRWLQVEVEFAAAPAFTDQVTVKYYVLFNGNLFTGEVTHVNVPAGRERRSVIYMPPHVLERYAGNRPLNPNTVQNVAVQIVQDGDVRDELSVARAVAQWYGALSPISGLLLNKNETPFAPLYWDRYEQIKTSGR
ncbi:MAG: Amuc_1102 family pilus-like protein [Chthoniobacterales bacterium]